MEKIARQRNTSVKRVVLFGPESTGKTTLAKELAEQFGVPWVPEFSREYLQQKWDRERVVCQKEDILHIAAGQMTLENQALEEAELVGKPFIVCDTNLLQTLVYSEVYYDGWVDRQLLQAVADHHYDLYLLTGIDVPWEADDLRDKPNEREQMYDIFQACLVKNQCLFRPLQGDRWSRLKAACEAIEELL